MTGTAAPSTRLPVRGRWALAGLTLLALGLRLFRLGFRSIWLDEAYSLRLAAGTFKQIWQGAAMDIHPPLFYWLLAPWLRMFGASEFALRALPALLGALLVPVLFRLADGWAGRHAAWWTAGLVAVSPYFTEISRMGRMPSLLALTSLVSLWMFWRFLRAARAANAFGYLAATLAALYTHYFAFLVLLGQHLYIFMGIGKLNLSRETRKRWLLLQAGLLAGYAVWLPHLWEHLSQGGPSWRGTGIRWFEPLHSLYAFWVGTACWTLACKLWAVGLLSAAAGLLVWHALSRPRETFQRLAPRDWGLLLTCLLAPLAVVMVYSVHALNVADNRYLSLPAALLLVVAGVLASGLPRRRALLAGGLILAAFAWPLFNQYAVYGYQDDWRSVGRLIHQESPADAAVAVYPPWNEAPLAYYLRGTPTVLGLPGHYDPITGVTEDYFYITPDTVDRLAPRVAGRDRLWLILVNDGESQQAIRNWFLRHYRPEALHHRGAIHIYRLVREEGA